MVALATETYPAFRVSDVELRAPTPSYTSVTLDQMARTGYVPSHLYFITGADAFAEIATWHDYPAVLDRSHFVVASRPGYPVRALKERLKSLAGRMRQPYPESLPESLPLSILLVDVKTTDVSSTEIRARLGRGREVSGLVAPAVDQYIRKHGLYRAYARGEELA
jgi:nicotinate-nucleotide adenylyltransferase